MDMRGLAVFISDIRKCPTKEAEQKRIDKELAKIRGKFKAPGMKGYDRKKYVCKLLYIYMLGYELDFGHIEAVNLLSSEKYSEKHCGYLACTILLHENHELVTLITNSMKRDLSSKNPDEQCLALTAIANIGGKEQAEALTQDIQRILVASDTKQLVRKKAACTLLNMYRKYPELLPADQWAPRIVSLLGSKDLGVIMSVMSLLLGFAANDADAFRECIPKVIRLLTKLVVARDFSPNYLYYTIAAPWLQVKLLRFLQYYPPPSDQALMSHLVNVVNRAIQTAEKKGQDKKNVSRNNAAHAVMFEALNVAIHYDVDVGMLSNSAVLLGRYLTDKDPNLRYLALDTLSRLAFTNHQEVRQQIRRNQDTVLLALKDPDISIRRRALDLLYSMCNSSNAEQIVGELLAYLPLSSYEIREELVLKIAILGEKFASDFTWYVDVILNLITTSGDFVSDEIWHRVIQVVTNRDEALQKYTAQTVFRAVSAIAAHETAVKVAGYILGEFGYLVADYEETSGIKQFEVLHSKFNTVSIITKQLLLTTYIKFFNLYEDMNLRQQIKQVFAQHRDFIDAELQQRANEYFALAESNEQVLSATLASMPQFPERESSVMRKIMERQSSKQSRAVRGAGGSATSPTEDDGAMEPAGGNVTLAAPQVGELKDDDLLGNLDDILGVDSAAPAYAATNDADPLSMLMEDPRPKQTPSAQPAQQTRAVDSLFDFGMPSQPNIAAQTASIAAQRQQQREAAGVSIEEMMGGRQEDAEVSKSVHADAEKKFVQLTVSSQGTAIEDQHLQVAIKSEFHGAKGRLFLLYGNKTENPISKVRVQCTDIPQVDVQMSQVAPMIAARAQVTQLVQFTCLNPFAGPIACSVYFEYDRKTYRFNIKLPVLVHKFVEPNDISNQQAFFAKWNSIPKGSPQESQEIVKPNGPINLEKCKSLLQTGLNLALCNGVDANPNNLVAAGTFFAQDMQHGVYLRLESNPTTNAYRVTVRSTDATVATQMLAIVKQQVEA